MPRILILLVAIALTSGCQKETDIYQLEECQVNFEVTPPPGFTLTKLTEFDFNGSIDKLEFINEDVGYALGGSNKGGYAVIFKTTNGGRTWENLDLGYDRQPRGLFFINENEGYLPIYDGTGCPDSCQNRCIILKTTDGGLSWNMIEYPYLTGRLGDFQFDDSGNIYAYLHLFYNQDDKSTSVMKSTNHGLSWDTLYASTELDAGNGIHLTLIGEYLFAAGKDGKIIKIDTTGNPVESIETGISKAADSRFINEQTIIVKGRSSEGVRLTTDGGKSWKKIVEGYPTIIDFQIEGGWLGILNKSYCPTDVYQVNDAMAFSEDGGNSWVEGETTTNMRLNFQDYFKRANGNYLLVINNEVLELSKN